MTDCAAFTNSCWATHPKATTRTSARTHTQRERRNKSRPLPQPIGPLSRCEHDCGVRRETATFDLGVSTPDAERFVDVQRVGQTLGFHRTPGADALGDLLALRAHVPSLRYRRCKEQVSRVATTRGTIDPQRARLECAHEGPS